MRRGLTNLVAIMNRHTKKALARRISKRPEAGFCVDALKERVHKLCPPEIMNADRNSVSVSRASPLNERPFFYCCPTNS